MIMSTTQLFSSTLGLEAPWKINDVQFDAAKHRLDIRIDFERVVNGNAHNVVKAVVLSMTLKNALGVI